MKSNYLQQTAIHQIDLALGQLTEETIPIWRSMLEQMKEQARDNEALGFAHTGTPEQREKAIPLLRERNKKIPYDPIVIMELARYDESHGKTDDALKDYAKLAVLPLFDQILHQIWEAEKAKNPSPRESAEKTLEEPARRQDRRLRQVPRPGLCRIDAQVRRQTGQAAPGRSRKPRRALRVVHRRRLRTIASRRMWPLPICSQAFATSEVVPLQYHEDIPQPDPLANRDSEARFHFYFPDRGGTPTFVIDGMPIQRGGLLHQAGDVYRGGPRSHRSLLDAKDVGPHSARGSAEGERRSASLPMPRVRSRRANPFVCGWRWSKSGLSCAGKTGFANTKMSFAPFLGGPQGIELKDSKFHYEGSVDLKAIREQLNDQLSAEEESQKIKFPAKPLELVASESRGVCAKRSIAGGLSGEDHLASLPNDTVGGSDAARERATEASDCRARRQEAVTTVAEGSSGELKTKPSRAGSLMRHATALVLCLATLGSRALAADAPPKSLDPRLEISLFADAPQIVTPTDVDVDHLGRVWAIECNTHFRPPNYKGHESDRLLVFTDENHDGKADRIETFADGFVYAMSVAVRYGDGVYLATRKDVFHLVDTNGDGKADRRDVILRLETPGDYPHNGLAGFAFDGLGFLYIGLGENLGAAVSARGNRRTQLFRRRRRGEHLSLPA